MPDDKNMFEELSQSVAQALCFLRVKLKETLTAIDLMQMFSEKCNDLVSNQTIEWLALRNGEREKGNMPRRKNNLANKTAAEPFGFGGCFMNEL